MKPGNRMPFLVFALTTVALFALACSRPWDAASSPAPSFWPSWWFRAVVCLTLITGTAATCWLQLRRLRLRKEEIETQAASRTKELAALNAVADVVSRSLDLDRILADALDKTLEVMETEAGGIYVLDEHDTLLRLIAQRGFRPEMVSEIDRLAIGEGFSGRVVQSGEPLVVRDVSQDDRLTRMVVRQEGLRSLAVVPLGAKGRVLGTLFAITRGYRTFSERDVQVLASIGNQIGVAVDNVRLFDTVQRRAEQFRVIQEVGRSVGSILELDDLLDQMAAQIQSSFGYYLVEVGLVEGDELVFLAGAGGTWGDEFHSFRVTVGREGITGWAAASGEPVLVADVSQDPRYVRFTPEVGTRSELAIPIKTQDRVLGVLNVEGDRFGAFGETDLLVLQSLANQAAIAIENARFFEAEKRRTEQFRVLAEVGRRLTLSPDIDEVLAQVVRLVQQAFGYYHVGIGLVEGDEVVYRFGAGVLWDDPEFDFAPGRLKVGEQGLSGWAAASGETVVVPDISREPRYVWMEGSETRSELLVPVRVKGEVVGVLDVQSDRVNAFDETDVAVLESLAHQAGAAIENARLYEQAQRAAVVEERQRLARELHDAVTQTLFSASLLAEALPVSWERDPEEGRQLLAELRQLSRGALAEMRTLLLELRPWALSETNLADLLRQLAEAAGGREGLPVAVRVEGEGTLPPEVHVSLYRIAQESLNNVVKHARASHVWVDLRYAPPGTRGVELRVRDNGRGFDPENTPPDHLGLSIMRERAEAIGASLAIDTKIGRGTEVAVIWPGGGSAD